MFPLDDKENSHHVFPVPVSHATQQQQHTRHAVKQMVNVHRSNSNNHIHHTRSHVHTVNADYHYPDHEQTLSGKKRVRSNNNSVDASAGSAKTHVLAQTMNLTNMHRVNKNTRSGVHDTNSKRARALTPEPLSLTASTVKDSDSEYIVSDFSSGSSSSSSSNNYEHLRLDSSASKQSMNSLTCLEPSDDVLTREFSLPGSSDSKILAQSSRSSSSSVDTQLISNIKNQHITAPVTRSKSTVTAKTSLHDTIQGAVAPQPSQPSIRSQSDVRHSNGSSMSTRSRPVVPTICTVDTIMLELDATQLEQMFVSEKLYQPSKDYFTWQQHLEVSMRSILFDWMMEVAQEFSLGRETYHLACNYVDRFLSINASTAALDAQKQQLRTTRRTAKPGCIDDPNRMITRSNLQLLGVTCLSVAAKFEEIYPPAANDFATTTDGAYTVHQIDLMERTVLKTLKWTLHGQTPYTWMKMLVKAVTQRLALDYQIRYQSLSRQSSNKNTQQLLQLIELHVNDVTQVLISVDMFERAMILIDMSSLDTHFLEYYPSAIAMSAFLLIYYVHYNYYSNTALFADMNEETRVQWFDFPIAEYASELTGYSVQVLQQCINRLQPYTQLALIDPAHYPQRRQVSDQHLDDLKIPKNELYGRQMHYTQALQLVQHTQAEFAQAEPTQPATFV